MGTKETWRKSLEIADQIISDLGQEAIAKELIKFKSYSEYSPTFDEYLTSLHKQIDPDTLFPQSWLESEIKNFKIVEVSSIRTFKPVRRWKWRSKWGPPTNLIENKTTKKTPVPKRTESFLF